MYFDTRTAYDGTTYPLDTAVLFWTTDVTGNYDRPCPEPILMAYLAANLALPGSAIASGTVAFARLPTGTSSSTVAIGDHNHAGVYQPLATALTDLAALDYASNALKVIRVNAGETAFELVPLAGGGDALVANTLDQFADVTQTAGKTLAITDSTTLAGGNHSGTNTGDNATNSLYSGLVSNATHTGDVTGSTALTLATAQPAVHTWALVQTFTVAPVFTDQSGSRTALGLGTLATQDGTFSGTSSGTNTGDQTTISGLAGSATILAAARTISGTGEATFTTTAFDGSAAVSGTVTLTNSAVIGKVLTGYTSGAGTVSDTDTILQAIQKLDGNDALKAPLASPTFTGTPTLPTGTIATTQSAADSTTKVATTAFVTTADNLKANLASPTFTGTPAAPTAAAGTNTTQIATTAHVFTASDHGHYRTMLSVAGSHIAGKVAGTYAIPHGDALAVSGTGTLYPIGLIHIVSSDLPTVNGLATKLRIRAQVQCNNVAPTGNFTIGLYPVTRPASSGGAGLNIYTLGTVVTGSDGATVTTPAADSSNLLVGSDFALPADGLYCLGVVTTATVAASAHVHICAQLQSHNA